jgi:hypothetical protein
MNGNYLINIKIWLFFCIKSSQKILFTHHKSAQASAWCIPWLTKKSAKLPIKDSFFCEKRGIYG